MDAYEVQTSIFMCFFTLLCFIYYRYRVHLKKNKATRQRLISRPTRPYQANAKITHPSRPPHPPHQQSVISSAARVFTTSTYEKHETGAKQNVSSATVPFGHGYMMHKARRNLVGLHHGHRCDFVSSGFRAIDPRCGVTINVL